MSESARFRLSERAAGVLLHPTSLPGPYGCGDLGPAAYAFVDFLAAAKQGWWQMLPTQPPGEGASPYSTDSAFAGSPLLISLERLVDDGLLTRKEIKPPTGLAGERVDFAKTARFRESCLRKAFLALFGTTPGAQHAAGAADFAKQAGNWLADYAIYQTTLALHKGKPWPRWPEKFRRHTSELLNVLDAHRDEYLYHCFVQYVYEQQWQALRDYAHARGVGLIGDIPIFIAHESADVWSQAKLFDLDEAGRPQTVSGVPPDVFSKTGQLWGHPQYRWEEHRRTGFAWWIARFQRILSHFDVVRVDHFLGFARLWAVPGSAKTAKNGKWTPTPGFELFEAVTRALGRVEVIAEDLGPHTKEAIALRDRYGMPGMRILQFAFDDDGGHYNRPHAYPRQAVVYTGTHDNNTTQGWFAAAPKATRQRALRYCGAAGARDMHGALIRAAYGSVADTAIIPAQDWLGLDGRARMNLPAKPTGNWQWRLKPGALNEKLARELAGLVELFGRVRRPVNPPAARKPRQKTG